MDIAVSAFYVLNEAALWVDGVPHEGAITDVIGKGGKEKAVFVLIEEKKKKKTVDGNTLFVYHKKVKSQWNNVLKIKKKKRP